LTELMLSLAKLARDLSRRLRFVSRPLSKLIYGFYENWLYTQISDGPMPKHIAIIPDGNRRWARSQGFDVNVGHEVGYERLEEVLKWLWELGVKVVTVYAMSYENCTKRSEEEKTHLFNLMKKGVDRFISERVLEKHRVRVRFLGRLDIIPEDLRSEIRRIEELSSQYSEKFLNVALCYGGRQEIVDAVRVLAEDVREGRVRVDEISEELFMKYLPGASHFPTSGLSEPDLVIRTSGELRISNFLLWHIAYSELYFCDVFWPEFRRIDLLRAIRAYQRRQRRFGA
jgi:tritrans,polycis-undecaprenyl-diphosphate synthase [geranylgeranyl-diphosphate specific]